MSQDPSSSPSINSDAPITAAQMQQILSQCAHQQHESVQKQVNAALLHFQQQAQPAAAAATSTSSGSGTDSGQSNRAFPISSSPLPAHVKLAKPSLFTGAPNSNVDTWLFEMEQYQTASGITDDAQRILVAGSYLKESASQWWISVCFTEITRPTTWIRFK